jgi:hypothetical protein
MIKSFDVQFTKKNAEECWGILERAFDQIAIKESNLI